MTDTTQQVYEYIVWFKGEYDGLAPSLREICRECGLGSTSVAVYHLQRLEAQGMVRLLERASRGIMVVGGRWKLFTTENTEKSEERCQYGDKRSSKNCA